MKEHRVYKILFITLVFISTSTHLHASNKKCDGANASQFSILLDLSEPLDKPSSIAFETLSQKMIDALPSGGKLNVYTIKTNAEEVDEPDFTECIPDFDNIKGKILKKKAIKHFHTKLQPEFKKISKVVIPSKSSPILENLFKISHSDFLRSTKDNKHTMVVISDLVQNSNLADFYKDIPSYDSFKKISTSWLPNANSVEIYLILINSPSSSKTELLKIRNFWLDYSKNNFKFCGFSGLNEAAAQFNVTCE